MSLPTPVYPKQEGKMLIVLIVLQAFSHQREGCSSSRALCLVKAQGFLSLHSTTLSLWQLGHLALGQNCGIMVRLFPYYCKEEETRIYREGQSLFIPLTLLCISVKQKYTFMHWQKPGSELQHVEAWLRHLHLYRVKLQTLWFPNCLLN